MPSKSARTLHEKLDRHVNLIVDFGWELSGDDGERRSYSHKMFPKDSLILHIPTFTLSHTRGTKSRMTFQGIEVIKKHLTKFHQEALYAANNVDNASAPSGGVQDAQKKPVDKAVANKCAECACEVYEKLEGYTICACGHLHPLVDADKLRSKLRDAAQLLASDGRLIPLAEADKLRGVAFVEGAGMFILRDYAYGVRDLDMSELRRRYPNKVVYFIGAAEVMEVK